MLRSLTRLVVALLVLTAPVLFVSTALAHCIDPAGECDEPCEVEDNGHCHSDDDCGPGADCVSWDEVPGVPCVSSECFCADGVWNCSDDCTTVCWAQPDPVPVTSPVGLFSLALATIVAGAIVFWFRRSG